MLHVSSKRIRRLMPEPQGLTCGIPSNWVVFGIGIASVIEAVAFLVTFAIIIEKVERGKKPTENETWWFTDIHIEKVTSYCVITLYVVRLISAGILIIGQYLRIAAFLATYFLLGLVGVVFNVLVGIEAGEHERTKSAGSAIVGLAIVHLVYACIVLKVCKEIRVEQLTGSGVSGPSTAHVPPPATPTAPAVTPEQRPTPPAAVIRNVPPPAYPQVYSNPYIPPANGYDLNLEPRSYRPEPVTTNEYNVQSSNRHIKPYEEEEDIPTIYYAPHRAPPRYSEIDIDSTAGRSGLQNKDKKDGYFGYSNA